MTTTRELFGAAGGALPATPGSYGQPPSAARRASAYTTSRCCSPTAHAAAGAASAVS